jgi:hypothetical protein
MSYRFLKLATIYPGAASAARSACAAQRDPRYAELREALLALHFGAAGIYPRELTRLGRGIDAREEFVNFDALQHAWAREAGVAAAGANAWKTIALAQVRAYRPDVLFFDDLYTLDRPFRAALRAACAPGTLCLGWRSAPTHDFGQFDDLDAVLTSIPSFVEALRACGVRSELLIHGFDPDVWDAIGPEPPRDLPFTFAGQTGAPGGPFSDRLHLLSTLLEASPLEVWSKEESGPRTRARRLGADGVWAANRLLRALGAGAALRRALPIIGRGADWTASPTAPTLHQRFPDRFHAPVFGVEFCRVLARSRVALNSHIDCASGFAANMRLFEATGLGACLLTDAKSNLGAFFELDREVVAYDSPDECIEKARWLLEHDAERESIARAGRARTMRDHTYARRAERLDELIQGWL